jgi:hypothetical protein
MKKIYEQYALLNQEQKILDAKIEDLKLAILQDMIDGGVETQTTSIGKFTISKLKKWQYPETITEAEDKLKAKKAKMQSTGEATYEESESLRFTPVRL